MPDGYFEKFSTNPVPLKPFDPKSKLVAQEYIKLLSTLLKDYQLPILHRGSTAFGISGKGDIEIGVYPSGNSWLPVINIIKEKIGNPKNIENDYIRFNDEKAGFEIEIILLKGRSAKVDIALTSYLINHPEILERYEEIKKQYSYSKREYQIQKDKFLRRVVESIPD